MNDSTGPERIGIFGGGFDPPHRGHVQAVEYALCKHGVDRVLVVPTAQHPFEKAHSASFEDRMRMAELAFLGLQNVEVSGIEAERQGPSRTFETVMALQQRYPRAKFFLILGSDHRQDCKKWYKWDALQALAHPYWIPRRGSSSEPDAIPNFNSSDIRNALTLGSLDPAQLPVAVLAYIQEYGLYLDKK